MQVRDGRGVIQGNGNAHIHAAGDSPPVDSYSDK